jgi:hypothetical protein
MSGGKSTERSSPELDELAKKVSSGILFESLGLLPPYDGTYPA